MLYCFDKNLPFDYSKSEMAIAKKEDKGILYDGEFEIFTDFFGNEVNISGKTIFPRTGVAQIYTMNEAIIKRGGIPVLSNNEIDKIIYWSKYYQTKRKMKTYLGKDLINPKVIHEIEKEFGQVFFMKTTMKNFSDIISISLLKNPKCVFYKALQYHLEDEFIISEPIKIESDQYGLKEYRCFVINNEIYNISRFTTEVFHEIDSLVLEKLKEIIALTKEFFSGYYVVDLMEYEWNRKKYIDVVEFNPIHSSGLYLYNSVLEKSEDILHTLNKKRIAKEFFPQYDNCKMDGQMINDCHGHLYNIKEGFSNDLKSIYLIGNRGLVFSEGGALTIECLAKNVEDFKWDIIESDEELLNCNSNDFSENEEAKEMSGKIARLLK